MNISKRQWYNLHSKLNSIMEKLEWLEKQIPRKEKKWLKFDECLPPASVCGDVFSMMNGNNTYTGFLGKLAEYYGCEPMDFYIDPQINPKYRAVYRPPLKAAYSRTDTASKRTVLHEFFHHLVNLRVVVVPKDEEEKYADKYAEIVMMRGS